MPECTFSDVAACLKNYVKLSFINTSSGRNLYLISPVFSARRIITVLKLACVDLNYIVIP